MANDSSSDAWLALDGNGKFILVEGELTAHEVHLRNGHCKEVWTFNDGHQVFCHYGADHHDRENKEAHEAYVGEELANMPNKTFSWYTRKVFPTYDGTCQSTFLVSGKSVKCRGARDHGGTHAGSTGGGTEVTWEDPPKVSVCDEVIVYHTTGEVVHCVGAKGHMGLHAGPMKDGIEAKWGN